MMVLRQLLMPNIVVKRKMQDKISGKIKTKLGNRDKLKLNLRLSNQDPRTSHPRLRKLSLRKQSLQENIINQTMSDNSDVILEITQSILLISIYFQMVNLPSKILIDFQSSNQYSKETSKNVVRFRSTTQNGTAALVRNQGL